MTVAFIGVLIWLNRRRAPAMKRAQEALAEREKSVEAEMEKVYELFDRSGEILGNKSKAAKRGYEGTTKKLTGNAFEDVDDLFVMSNEVRRVKDEAKEIDPPEKGDWQNCQYGQCVELRAGRKPPSVANRSSFIATKAYRW